MINDANGEMTSQVCEFGINVIYFLSIERDQDTEENQHKHEKNL